jgi:accessory gene regulator protein AgrB
MQPHPLWQYLPAKRRTRKEQLKLQLQRLVAWLKRKRQLIILFLVAYIILWLIPLLFEQGLITAFAFLPLILVPPVGLLIYWLVWEDFHG